jgi:CubicO group peptidase (beta-lactamase class C family)
MSSADQNSVMPPSPDRRTVSAALAALFTTGGAPPPDALEAILNPPNGPPMASAGLIARRGNGAVAVKLAGGQAFGPAGQRPFGLDMPFRVASVSKMIATSVFLPLANARGFDLDADVSGPLGFPLRHPSWPEAAITTRMLLTHTSGLRNGPSYPVPLGHKLAEAFLPDGRHYDSGGWFGPPEHRPGAWFAYADVNFALVAQLMERLTGERFDTHMRKALFQPLGLDIGYNWSGVSQAKRTKAAAAVRQVDGRWAPQVDASVPPFPAPTLSTAPGAELAAYRPGDNGFVFSPQGGLRLSLMDMDRLARMFVRHGDGVVTRGALEAMQARAWALDRAHPNGDLGGVFQSYGLGCETPVGTPAPNGDAFFGPGTGDWRGHSGDAYGWMTGLFWNRRDGRTLVWAVNGMPEKDRPAARNSALTAPEEALLALALGT